MDSLLTRLTPTIDWIAGRASGSGEPSRRRAFTLIALLKCGGCVLWAAMFLLLGLTAAAAFPAFFALIWLMSIALYRATKRFSYFVNIPLFVMLVLPLPLQYVLGGFTSSGAVVLWCILTPVAALVFRGVREAKFWFAGFLLVILCAVVLEAYVVQREPTPLPVVGLFFMMNIGVVTGIVFSTIAYFVSQVRVERDNVQKKNQALEQSLLQLTENAARAGDEGEDGNPWQSRGRDHP